MGELKKPWKIFYKAFGNTKAEQQRWVIDIDLQDDIDNNEYISRIVEVVNNCQYSHEHNLIKTIKTKSGYHLITHPFNVKEYNDKMEFLQRTIWGDNVDIPDIKKNHLTLLYENL